MPRYDDDEYDARPVRRSKPSKYRDDDEPEARPRGSYAPESSSSSRDKRSARDYGDPRDVEPRGSGSDRDRKPRRHAYDEDDDDDRRVKSSSKRDQERSSHKKYYPDEDDSIAPLPKSRSHKPKDLDSEILAPRKNEGRPRRSNTLESDDYGPPKRTSSKRESGYDDRRDKRSSRYKDYDEDSEVPVKPHRSTRDDRGYKSHDEGRPGRRSHYDEDVDDRPRRSDRRKDPYEDYRRSEKDRDRGYRSMDEGKRRDSHRGSDRDRDRERDRPRDRYNSYSDRDRDRYGDRDRARRSGSNGGKYGIKLDPDTLKTYYETGAKHYQTFKPIINSMAKMYMDSRKAG